MKTIKNITIVMFVVLFFAACSEAEEKSTTSKPASKTDDVFATGAVTKGSREAESSSAIDLSEKMTIKLTPFTPEYKELGASGSKLMKDRLNAGITKIGYGGEGSNPRFVVGPSVSLLTQDITATAPPKYANTYEINVMVVDVVDETVFNSYKTEFKGVGDSPEKAFISGIRNISFENQKFIDFLLDSESKIIEYFESNCSTLMSEAEAEAGMRNYENAFTILKTVPKEAADCFTAIQTKKTEYFQASLNDLCNELLAKMRAELGKYNDPSASGFNAEAMHYYSMIDSKSECFEDAQKEYAQYLKKLNPTAKRDWEQKMQVYKDEIAMVKADKEFVREEAQQAYDYKVKMAELEAETQIEGNQKLLAKYKHDESPWLIRLFSSGSKLFKGEMNTD